MRMQCLYNKQQNPQTFCDWYPTETVYDRKRFMRDLKNMSSGNERFQKMPIDGYW